MQHKDDNYLSSFWLLQQKPNFTLMSCFKLHLFFNAGALKCHDWTKTVTSELSSWQFRSFRWRGFFSFCWKLLVAAGNRLRALMHLSAGCLETVEAHHKTVIFALAFVFISDARSSWMELFWISVIFRLRVWEGKENSCFDVKFDSSLDQSNQVR